MKGKMHVHLCHVAEDPAGVFHARSAGARSVRPTNGDQRKGRVIRVTKTQIYRDIGRLEET